MFFPANCFPPGFVIGPLNSSGRHEVNVLDENYPTIWYEAEKKRKNIQRRHRARVKRGSLCRTFPA